MNIFLRTIRRIYWFCVRWQDASSIAVLLYRLPASLRREESSLLLFYYDPDTRAAVPVPDQAFSEFLRRATQRVIKERTWRLPTLLEYPLSRLYWTFVFQHEPEASRFILYCLTPEMAVHRDRLRQEIADRINSPV